MDIWGALLHKMRTARERRIGPREAERLLTAPGSDPAYPELSALLAAAAAAPREAELTGMEAALAAYQNAAFATAAPARRRWVVRSFAAKAVAGTAVLLLGGTALAAETGNLPAAAQRHAHDLLAPLGVPPPPPPTSRPTPSRPAAASTAPTVAPTPTPVPSNRGRTLAPTSPAVQGLCRAWQAHQKNPNGKAMTAEAFRDLARVAGGESKIAAFCAPLLSGGQNKASAEPTRSPKTKKSGKQTPKG